MKKDEFLQSKGECHPWGQGHMIKNFGKIGKVLSKGTHMAYIEALTLIVQYGQCQSFCQRMGGRTGRQTIGHTPSGGALIKKLATHCDIKRKCKIV